MNIRREAKSVVAAPAFHHRTYGDRDHTYIISWGFISAPYLRLWHNPRHNWITIVRIV